MAAFSRVATAMAAPLAGSRLDDTNVGGRVRSRPAGCGDATPTVSPSSGRVTHDQARWHRASTPGSASRILEDLSGLLSDLLCFSSPDHEHGHLGAGRADDRVRVENRVEPSPRTPRSERRWQIAVHTSGSSPPSEMPIAAAI